MVLGGVRRTLLLNLVKRSQCNLAHPSAVPSATLYGDNGKIEWRDTFCDGRWFGAGTGPYDVGDYFPQIIIITGVGPSFGSRIHIYRWTDHHVTPVALPKSIRGGIADFVPWRPKGGQVLLAVTPLNKDFPSPPLLFHWTVAGYKDVSAYHQQYYRGLPLVPFYSHAVPPDGWVWLARYDSALMRLQGKRKAIRPFLVRVLDALEDPNRTRFPLPSTSLSLQKSMLVAKTHAEEHRRAKQAIISLLRSSD